MNKPRPFHRLFGLAWLDLFEGTSARVEPELDMAKQQMLLDVAISLDNPESLRLPLPDGCEVLCKHNVLTFKSYREAIDNWALLELIHHYVSRRYQVSPKEELLPARDFGVFAVCVRRPQVLGRLPGLVEVRPGVYEVTILELTTRLVVIHDLPLTPNNAMLHLFSAREDAVRFGMSHYRNRSTEISALICALFKEYLEDASVSNLLKEFAQKTIDELLESLPSEQRLRGISVEERLKGVPAEERLKGVPAEERLKGVPAEERLKGVPAEERLAGLSAEEVLQGLSPEALKALVQKLEATGATPKSE